MQSNFSAFSSLVKSIFQMLPVDSWQQSFSAKTILTIEQLQILTFWRVAAPLEQSYLSRIWITHKINKWNIFARVKAENQRVNKDTMFSIVFSNIVTVALCKEHIFFISFLNFPYFWSSYIRLQCIIATVLRFKSLSWNQLYEIKSCLWLSVHFRRFFLKFYCLFYK